MNSVDRATLIDFALGRLNDAEAADLVRRAEQDSEFAQTLDALRRELATLDVLRPSALLALPRPVSPLESASQDVRDEAKTPADADESRALEAESLDEERVLFLDSFPANAVKVRRVGPVYPYYPDEDASAAESSVLQGTLASNCEETAQDAEITQDASNALRDANLSDTLDKSDDETSPDDADVPNVETCSDDADESNLETCPDDADVPNVETCSDDADKLNAQLNANEQDDENGLASPNDVDAPSARATQTPSSRRRRFIPKFIAASRASQRSPFVAKKARRLDATDAAPGFDAPSFARPLADLNQETSVEKHETLAFDAAVESTDAEFRPDGAPPIDETSAARPSDEQATFVDDVSAPQTLDEAGQINEEKQVGETFVSRENDEPNGEEKQVGETFVSRENDEPNGEELDAETDSSADETPFPRVAATSAESRLAELLGRAPTKFELDEYYWEPIVETAQVEYQPSNRGSLFGAATRLTTEPAVAVGRATLAICGFSRPSALGSDAFAATKPRRRRQQGKVSDMMISSVFGFLIAVIVVWPLICLAANELFSTIVKSAARKIGVTVPVSENAPQSDILPLISEQLVFPDYSESAALQAIGVKGAGEPEPLPAPSGSDAVVPRVDPASTPPTLSPASTDDEFEEFEEFDMFAPVVVPRNAQE